MDVLFSNLAPRAPEIPTDKFSIYHSQQLTIVDTTFIMPGDCCCDQFLFLIPTGSAPRIVMGNRQFCLKTDNIFAFNPSQSHHVIDNSIGGFRAFVLYLTKDFLSGISESIYHSDKLELQNDVFPYNPKIRYLIHCFIQELQTPQPGSELLVQSLRIQIGVELLRESSHNLSSESKENEVYSRYYSDKISIKKAIDYMQSNFDRSITLDELASETNYSSYHFLRLFKTETGITPFHYLMNIKIEKAKTLLRNSCFSIEQVGDFCGFKSSSHFTQSFKKMTGASPSVYRSAYIPQHR